MAKILVTGASGFVGRHLVPVLQAHGYTIVEAGRTRRAQAQCFVPMTDIDGRTDWKPALQGVKAVVHLAGIAHRSVPDEVFHAVNDAGTGRLVEACRESGVQSMILLSSIAARDVGRRSQAANAYGRSKLAGEGHLMAAVRSGSMSGIVLRPPLVYGHDAPGNWHRLQRLAASGMPLPFGSISNRRSLCSANNLCHGIACALRVTLEGRGSGIYEIADRDPVSLATIITELRRGMGRNPRLVPAPPGLLKQVFGMAGQARLSETLLDDLRVDPTDFMDTFAWLPPQKAKEAIRESGRLFAENRKSSFSA